MILNSLAMTFILQIDELLASRLCTVTTKTLMQKLEPFDLFHLDREEVCEDEEVLEEFNAVDGRWHVVDCKQLLLLVPKRFATIAVLTAVAYVAYFARFCSQTKDGSYVSEPLYP